MALYEINAALVRAWQSVALAFPTAYEGKTFDPASAVPEGHPWAAVFLLPANEAPAGLGIHAPIEHVGVFQIDLNYPLDSGAPDILKAAGVVKATFAPGTSFTFDGTQVNVERSQSSSIRQSDGWLKVSLSVRWRGWQHRVNP